MPFVEGRVVSTAIVATIEAGADEKPWEVWRRELVMEKQEEARGGDEAIPVTTDSARAKQGWKRQAGEDAREEIVRKSAP